MQVHLVEEESKCVQVLLLYLWGWSRRLCVTKSTSSADPGSSTQLLEHSYIAGRHPNGALRIEPSEVNVPVTMIEAISSDAHTNNCGMGRIPRGVFVVNLFTPTYCHKQPLR
jgi:hypothetical protein